MKKQMRILAILLFSASILGCSNGNKNSNKVKEQELPKESKLFDDLLSLTQNLNQFKGTAFVGSLNGPCYMVLTGNSQGDNIAKLRYQINNYSQGKVDKVDETYTITDLKRKSAKKNGFGLNNTRDYEDTYLYGSVKGFKASINDGAITDGSGSGNIRLVLDSVNSKITYVMTSSANWSFQGSVRLATEQYIKFKELFENRKLSKKEIENINKAKDIIKITSSDSNFISLGNYKFKVLISKKKLINTNRNGWTIEPLFTGQIENISNKNIDRVDFKLLYPDVDKKKRNPNGYDIFWFFNGSSIHVGKNISMRLNDNKSEFKFNLRFEKSRLYPEYSQKWYHLKDSNLQEVLNDETFLNTWGIVNSSPALKLEIYDKGRGAWEDLPIEIYFELVD
jgi:hypothetical protein